MCYARIVLIILSASMEPMGKTGFRYAGLTCLSSQSQNLRNHLVGDLLLHLSLCRVHRSDAAYAGRYSVPVANTAQPMRASLLASATVALLTPRSALTRLIHRLKRSSLPSA